MKKKIFLLILIFTGIICYSSFVNAQDCDNSYNDCSKPKEKYFTKSGMSRSIKIKQKQRKTFNLFMFEGNEYYISVCGNSQLGNIQLRLLNDNNKLMYDNAAAGMENFIIVKSELSKMLVIEVSAPIGKFTDNESECLGVYVATNKITGKNKRKKH